MNEFVSLEQRKLMLYSTINNDSVMNYYKPKSIDITPFRSNPASRQRKNR